MNKSQEIKIPLSKNDLTIEGLSAKVTELREKMDDAESKAMEEYLECCSRTVSSPETMQAFITQDPSLTIPVATEGWKKKKELEDDNQRLKFAFELVELLARARIGWDLQKEYEDDLRYLYVTPKVVVEIVFPLTLPGLIAESHK